MAARAAERKVTAVMYVGLELGLDKWVACFADGRTERVRKVESATIEGLLGEVEKAKAKLAVSKSCRVMFVQEAGRQGFWIHRALEKAGLESLVVDSSSIEVPRKFRRNKTDKLDARALSRLAIRFDHGEPKALRVCQVPTVEQEDARRPTRERMRLKKERTAQTNRIKALLYLHGRRLQKIDQTMEKELESSDLPPNLRGELIRSLQRWSVIDAQLRQLASVKRARIKELKTNPKPGVKRPRATGAELKELHLTLLRGIGPEIASLLTAELFGWRTFRNRRQVGAAAGLVSTIQQSCNVEHHPGISKSGNPRVRWMMLQAAWSWLRFQPQSQLARWYERRFAHGGSRQRRIGIVAVARRLLVDLWKYVEQGVVPEGAEFGKA
jgi:transposase